MNASLEPGAVTELAPGVRRVVAPNPGAMTGPGTNTYLLGLREVAIIDPGPDIPDHVNAILHGAGANVRWVLATHTHSDHSPAAAALARKTGAVLLGMPAPKGQHQDPSFMPDRILNDGDTLVSEEFSLKAIHTPGHASNHLCYLHAETNWLFSGDHIINGSTVVIDPPDGNMSEYLRSLERLGEMDIRAIAPGHGEIINEPYAAIVRLIAHRLKREATVAAAVSAHGRQTVEELVRQVYRDVSPSLYPVAERSLLAHLEKLERDGRVMRHKQRWCISEAG